MEAFIQGQNTPTSSHVLHELSRINLRSPNEQLDSSPRPNVAYNQDSFSSLYQVSSSPTPVMRLLYDERKFLSSARVVQGNIVCVFNLPPHLEEGPHLKDFSHFGRYGQVVKVTLRRKLAKAKTLAPSSLTQKGAVSAFIVYRRCEDALRAIISLSKMKISGRQLKATLGSAVYCKNALRGLACNEPNCVKLHFKCAMDATFNAEQMANGLHITYQRKKLIEIYQNNFSNWGSSQFNHSQDQSAIWISPGDLEEYLTDLASMEFAQEQYLYSNTDPCTTFNEDSSNRIGYHIQSQQKSSNMSGQASNFYSPRGSLAPYEIAENSESRRPSALSSTTLLRQMMLNREGEMSPDVLKVETVNSLGTLNGIEQTSLSEGSSPLSEMLPKTIGPLQLSPRQQQMLMLLRKSAASIQDGVLLGQHSWDSNPLYSSGRSNSWPTENGNISNTKSFTKLLNKSSNIDTKSWYNHQVDSGFGSTLSCRDKNIEDANLKSCFTPFLPIATLESNMASLQDHNRSPVMSPDAPSTESDCYLDGSKSDEEIANSSISDVEQIKKTVTKTHDSSSDESGLDCMSYPDSGLISSSALDFDPVEAAKHGLAKEMLCESAIRLAELAIHSLSYLSSSSLPASSMQTLKKLIANINKLVETNSGCQRQSSLEDTSSEENYQSLVNLQQNLVTKKKQYLAQLQQSLESFKEDQNFPSSACTM